MSNTISSSYSNMLSQQSMGMRPQRPNPEAMAEDLFSKLDTSGKGYIEAADLQAAMNSVASSSESSASSDELFASLDQDSDGKVTVSELSARLSELSDSLDEQFQSSRMNEAMGGMPPPPPPQNDTGFTKDELTAQLEEIGSSDSQRASLISNIVQNFDAADTDGDGKVSFEEAMSFDQSSQQSTGTGSTSTDTSEAAASNDLEILRQIEKLMQAYLSNNQETASTLLTTA